MATRQYPGDDQQNELEVERAVKGPRGTKVFGRDWLFQLKPSEYRNYLCRAFTYCEIKERFRAEPDQNLRQAILQELEEVINGIAEPELPSIEKLSLYFQKNRFPIVKTKKGGTKKLQRHVIIDARGHILQYFSKEEGGQAKKKTYSIDDITFKRIRDASGRPILNIQPKERPHGPISIVDPSVNITEVYNNIMALKRSPERLQSLEQFLRIYNYSITKRILQRFIDVHRFIRDNFLYRKKTVEDIRAISLAGQRDAVELLRDCLQRAQQEWMEQDDIFPPHFLGADPLKEEVIIKSLTQLYEDGLMRDLTYGRSEKMTLFNLEYRGMKFRRARFSRDIKEISDSMVGAINDAHKRLSQGKVSLKQVAGKKDVESPLNFDMDTIPFEEVSMIYVNPDPRSNSITVCGRIRRAQNIRAQDATDPADHGFYLPRRSAMDQMDIIRIGFDKINLRDSSSSYEYALYATIGERRVLIKEFTKPVGSAFIVNKTCDLGFTDSRKESIVMILLRRSGERDGFEACFRQKLPYSATVPKQKNEVYKVQNGAFKVYYNYELLPGCPGNSPTLDGFGSRLTPGSIVGFRVDETHYELGMVIGMKPNGRQVILEPGVVNKPVKRSVGAWRATYQKRYVDYEDILFESYEHKFAAPTYWLDYYPDLVSPTMRSEDLQGMIEHEWQLTFQFTFPVQQMVALIHLQQKLKDFNGKAYDIYRRNMSGFISIGPDIVQDIPLMGTIQVEVFSCSNVQNYRSSDKYNITARAKRNNEVYESPDIDDHEFQQARKNMHQWNREIRKPESTNQATHARLQNSPNDILRWQSSIGRLLDLGLFYADTTERKVIVLELVRNRGGNKQVVRECEVQVEYLMDLNAPISTRYLHMHKPEDEQTTGLTTECLLINFIFFPTNKIIDQKGLRGQFYKSTAGLLRLMRERRRLTPEMKDTFDNVVSLGTYDPNMINKFYKSFFYEHRDDELLDAANGIYDVFIPEKSEATLLEGIENDRSLRPPIEESTFKMRQARLWEISQQQSYFYTSYVSDEYVDFHKREAARQHKQPNFSGFESSRFINEELGSDPNMTIDMNLEQDQANTEQFRTMFSIVKRGIPKKFRFKIWFQMLNCDKILTAIKAKIRHDDVYEHFMHQADNSSSHLLDLIDQDLAKCELLPIAPTTRLPNVGASMNEMKEYAQEAAASKRARDAHVKGAIRLVLRAYAMYINFENPNQSKPFVYHRGLIWIVYRLVHGGIIDSQGNAFKILIGLAHEMELIFRRNEKTILLNKLDTEGRAFSNLYFEDFMLRVVASIEVFYPDLARKIKNFGLPIEYYIGQKFLSMFADNTLPAEHIYLIWDLIIFYSGLEQESYIYGNILPLGATLFFFKNVIDKRLDRKVTSAQELKYLVDNPFILDLENMSVPNFSDKVLDIYESLFPSNILGRILSKPADIERRYVKLHAAYKREFMKNFFHNDVFLQKLRNPAGPLAERDFQPVEQELKRLTQKSAKQPEIAVNVIDYHLVKQNIEEVFGQRLQSKCKFIIGVKYGNQAEKFMTVLNEGLDKQSVDVVRFSLKDWQDKLEIRLYVSKFAGALSHIKDDISEPEEALLSPTRKGQNRIMRHNTEREIQSFTDGKFLTFNKTVRDHSSSDILIASAEIRLDNLHPNVFYKSWYSLKWHSGENEQRAILHKLQKALLAHPPEPEVLITVASLNPVIEAKDKTTFKLQRGIQCRLPQVSNFGDSQFTNQEDFIESLLASYKQKLSEDLGQSMQVSHLGGWVINSNFNIVMPPYRPMNLKSIVPRKKSSKTTTKEFEEFKAIEGGVPLRIQDIDPFQPEFTPDDDFRFLDHYIGPQNLPTLLLQLGHQGPNFEENRRYLGKIREFIQRTWEREEIPPSRIIPLSIRNMMAIIILRSQFSFRDMGEKLYRLVALPFFREPEQLEDETFYRVNPYEAASVAQIICERLMVPISGFQVANWVQSALFGGSAQILQASIVSEKTRMVDGFKEDVTDLLQRYCHFCHERIGRKVLFLPGLNTLAEFKAAVKKISPPRLLMITFSTNSGGNTTEMLYIDAKGNIADAPGEADLNADERIFRQQNFFSLEGVHDIEGTVSLDSLLSLPVISDWLRMEVSLKSHKSKTALSGTSIFVDVVGADAFKFMKGNRRDQDFTLQFGGKFRGDEKERMGELLQSETLSDIRYRIMRFFLKTNNEKMVKRIEGYVFKTRDGVREINEFISVRQLFSNARGTVHLVLGPSSQETMSTRIGDPPLLIGKKSFGRIAQGDLVKERIHIMNQQIEPNAYALFINGDGSSTFQECEAEACEPGKVMRSHDLPNELYRVRFAGSNIWYLRSRKEIILTHSHWLNEQKYRR